MPVLKHAKKKLKQDKKRTARNKSLKEHFKDFVKIAKKVKTQKAVNDAFSAVDKAAKNNIIHKNKAAHLKSSLSELIAGEKPAAKTEKKETPKKTIVKSSSSSKKGSSKSSKTKTSKKS